MNGLHISDFPPEPNIFESFNCFLSAKGQQTGICDERTDKWASFITFTYIFAVVFLLRLMLKSCPALNS